LTIAVFNLQSGSDGVRHLSRALRVLLAAGLVVAIILLGGSASAAHEKEKKPLSKRDGPARIVTYPCKSGVEPRPTRGQADLPIFALTPPRNLRVLANCAFFFPGK
jgi:hypothetical protein